MRMFTNRAQQASCVVVRQLSRGELRRSLYEQMHVVGLHEEVLDLDTKLGGLLSEQHVERRSDLLYQHGNVVFRAPEEVDLGF
jgi:hypothetical protein